MTKRGEGKNWFEVVVAVSALLVSAVSLWVAWGTEDANRKMVSAASWPLIQFISSDADAQTHTDVIRLSVSNDGVGPAKIETFELFYKTHPMHDVNDLLRTCCRYVRPVNHADRPLTSTVPDSVLRAGEMRPFLIFAKTDGNTAVYERLNDVREGQIDYRACYCSVFDECWVSDTRSSSPLKPTPVKVCQAAPVAYRD